MHKTHVVNQQEPALDFSSRLNGRHYDMQRPLRKLHYLRGARRQMRQTLAGQLVRIRQGLVEQALLHVAKAQCVETFILNHLVKIREDLRARAGGNEVGERHFHRTGQQL